MCGIVGCGNPTGLIKGNFSIFENLLIADTVRGPHSTGVYLNTAKSNETDILKLALNGAEFVESEEWQSFREAQAYKKGRATPPKVNFLCGHNRWATMGAVNAKNAHPFRCGDVTLVHNGTIDDVTILPDYLDYEVDSENVCHSINKIGLEETIKVMDGAFTLAYHQKSDNTMHFIRNSRRPLYMVRTNTNVWYWASEKAMLLWVLGRSKTYVTIAEEFELAVGEELIFDVNNTFKLKEKKQHKLPTFSVSTSYWPNYASRSSRTGRNVSIVDTILADNGASIYKKGDEVEFTTYDFRRGHQKIGGRPTGYVSGYNLYGSYFEVEAYAFPEDLYEAGQTLVGTISGARVNTNGTLTVTVMNPHTKRTHLAVVVDNTGDELTELNDDLPEGILKDDDLFGDDSTVKLTTGEIVTRKKWEGERNSHCGFCDTQIPFEDASSVEYVCQSPCCESCWDDLKNNVE